MLADDSLHFCDRVEVSVCFSFVLFVAAVRDDLEQQSVAAASVRGQHVDVLEVVSSRVEQQRAVVARATPVEVVGSARLLSRDEVVGDVREVLDGLLRKPDCRVGGLETVDAIEHGLFSHGQPCSLAH